MKMKKVLVILAAFSVLGITGCGNDETEESVATIEPVTEVVTTTETEAETTVAETIVETEVETTVTEEEQTEQGNGTIELGSKSYQIEQNGITHDVNVVYHVDYTAVATGVEAYNYLSIYIDDTLVESFLDANATLHDEAWKEKLPAIDIDRYFSVDGDVMNVTIRKQTTAYRYDETSGTLVETDNSTAEEDISQPITGDFELDGVTLTPKIEYKGEMGDDDGGLFLNIYSTDGTLLFSIRVELFNGGSGRPEDYGKVSRYLVKTGARTITVNDYSDYNDNVSYHSYVFENGEFVS